MAVKSIKKLRSKSRISFENPVLVVSRSNKNILVQVIEAVSKKTLATFTSNAIAKVTKTDKSTKVGEEVGKYLKAKKITKIIFNRNGYLFHGRIKALVDAVRKNGIEI
jgi:large subunit ribosomal protein L18